MFLLLTNLSGIFIECSYDDSQSTDTLFGHLAPRFLIEELDVLAREVIKARKDSTFKQPGNGTVPSRNLPTPAVSESSEHPSPLPPDNRHAKRRALNGRGSKRYETREREPSDQIDGAADEEVQDHTEAVAVVTDTKQALKGIRIIIIHMKEKLDDKPHVSHQILRELREYAAESDLGCAFVIAKAGESIYL